MSKESWLLMRCSGELDTIFVIAHCPVGFLEKIERRRQDLVNMSAKVAHSGISGAQYWHSVDVYEMPDMEEVLIDEELLELFESQDWVCVSKNPDASGLGDELRIEGCELNIPVIGDWFYWSFVPKHGTMTYETPGVSIRDMIQETK